MRSASRDLISQEAHPVIPLVASGRRPSRRADNLVIRLKSCRIPYDSLREVRPPAVTPPSTGGWHGSERDAVSYTHLRAHETRHELVCRLLLENKKKKIK